jgi:hypothetical protein
MSVFKCQQCGNLHGAPVEACGMCGSPSVVAVDEQGNAFPGPGTPQPARLPPAVDSPEVSEALLGFLHAGAAFFRANTPTVRDPEREPDPEGGGVSPRNSYVVE